MERSKEERVFSGDKPLCHLLSTIMAHPVWYGRHSERLFMTFLGSYTCPMKMPGPSEAYTISVDAYASSGRVLEPVG